ncbi:MAG TPA: hypothetical protein VF297_04310 [Pyrinomonadaceae bacterium]
MAFIVLAAVAAVSGLFKGAFTGPDDVQLADPARAVADARRLIAEQGTSPDSDKALREPGELPESLRLPGLRYSFVHEDHLDLVLARNPDWNIGARIWSADASRRHADQPTKYPEVFFFRYTNDAEESAANIR